MDATAVIGAGLTGLAAATALSDAGRAVRVFDKSRGTGGRLATRRTDVGSFDHGAPRAQGGEFFDAAMAGFFKAARREGDGWLGHPGMSGLVNPLAARVNVEKSRQIVAVEGEPGEWVLRDADGGVAGPFAQVIAAIPAPQVARLLPQASEPLRDVEMAPCWTLMALRPDGAALPKAGGAIAQVIDQSDRPGAGPGALVAHATAEWSRERLEWERREIYAALVAALGLEEAPYTAVHRWRFARTSRPLGAPFLDLGGGILAGGDWATGPHAGDAWASGRAMAAHLV